MVIIARSIRFEKEYKKFVKRDAKRAASIIKTLELFVNNPRHPSLNIEKLWGSNFWTIRLSEGDRIYFLWADKNTVLYPSYFGLQLVRAKKRVRGVYTE